MNLGFIGVGNMGGAIAKGYACAQGENGGSTRIFLLDHNPQKLASLAQMGAIICHDAAEMLESSDIIMIGVKPSAIESALEEIIKAETFSKDKIFVSMAAGVMISKLEKFLGADAKICRIMPNTPAFVGAGMISLSCNSRVSDDELNEVKIVLETLGRVQTVDEELIHCVIGVSGSSPAYTYMYIEALANAAVENGMNPEQAIEFAAQSVFGAAKMVLETGVSPEQLRINVCSPGGTTIEAVNVLESFNFQGTVKKAFNAAVAKSKQMSGK